MTKNNKYSVLNPNRMLRAFWSLNEEMNPAFKVTFVREIDMSAIDNMRQTFLEKHHFKPSYTAFIIKAAALTLKEFPYANRGILGIPPFQKLVQFHNFDITVAVERNVPDAESVVLADTICDCLSIPIKDLNSKLQNLTNATLESNPRWRLFHNLLNKIPPFISKWLIRMPRFSPSMWIKHRGGACFVNSPAKYGIDLIVGDMLWPLTVSYGWIRERPFIVNGTVTVRKTMPLIIIFDRRIMAGAPAAHFFSHLADLLEKARLEDTPD